LSLLYLDFRAGLSENTRRRQENEASRMPPRKKIARGLPPLPSRVTFKAKKHQGAQLLEILRGIAIANQQEEPQVFYPLREVARHLGVPVSTVSRVYDDSRFSLPERIAISHQIHTYPKLRQQIHDDHLVESVFAP